MSFNIYDEAKSFFEELAQNTGMTIRSDTTLNDLIEEDGRETEYQYSVYNGALFEAISEDLSLLAYCEDIEREFGQGIATNPLSINEAILRYIEEEYGHYDASDFDYDYEEYPDEDELDEAELAASAPEECRNPDCNNLAEEDSDFCSQECRYKHFGLPLPE